MKHSLTSAERALAARRILCVEGCVGDKQVKNLKEEIY